MKKFIKTIVAKKSEAVVESPINHIMVIDCSGSMSYDLPKIRKQLKNKLPSLVKDGDTVSLVWFSGKGEFGRLVDRVKVKDLTDFERLNVAVDRWLKPVGCTGFVEPLNSVKELIKEEDGCYSMMFLTDGYDNEWSKEQIIDATKELSEVISGAVFVEYGYYCNHALLEEMATEIGGSVLFAEDFDSYDPIFDNVMSNNSISTKKVEVELIKEPLFGLVYSISENGVSTYKVENNKVRVPENTEAIYYFADEDVDKVCFIDDADFEKRNAYYREILSGLSVLVLQRKGQFVKSILKELGLNSLYNKFSNCFGKQALYDFQKSLTASDVFDSNENIVDNSSAYSVINLLRLLQLSKCEIAIDKMKYNRIGRATVQEETLSEKEKEDIANSIKLASTADEIAEIMNKSQSLLASKKKLKFTAKTNNCPISSVTWNDTRPNVSLLFKIDGTVELSDDRPEGLPKEFETFVHRNYTIIRDGLVNVEFLPVILDEYTYFLLQQLGFPDSKPFVKGEVTYFNLKNLPLINENMIKEVSAKDYFENIYKLNSLKASAKVYKHFKDIVCPESRSEGISDKYDENVANYLATVGITDGGFAPKVQTVKGSDFYMATELIAKIKGISKVPSVNAVMEKVKANKKLNAADNLIYDVFSICESNQNNMTADEFVEWLSNELYDANDKIKELSGELAQTRFAIIVGQTWFKEFNSIENCSMTLKLNGNDDFECSVEIKDTTVSI